MKPKHLISVVLLIILIISRLVVRHDSQLWTDEIEQIKHLTSFSKLIFVYLPHIPSGWPGHYVLTLPINTLFPGNKFALGTPGLIAHIAVFFSIPLVLKRLFQLEGKTNMLASTIARSAFILDTTFTFQSMEIRPYSVLPLLWILTACVTQSLFNIRWNKLMTFHRIKKVVVYSICFLIIFTWHFYGFIMTTSILLYIIAMKRFKSEFSKLEGAVIPFLFSTIAAIPLWRFFSSGSGKFKHPPLEMVPSFQELVSGNRGVMVVQSWQHILYVILIAFVFITIVYMTVKKNDSKESGTLIRGLMSRLLFLVIAPTVFIITLDIVHPYWILYRQFAWTALPLYLTLSAYIGQRLYTTR